MKLNPDCIRDVLLYLEGYLEIDLDNSNFKMISLNEIIEHFSELYTEEDIWYTVYNLKEIRFIEGNINNAGKHKMFFCEISNITWNGHQFLNTIRPKNIWDATKSGAKKIGATSISALNMIATEITKAIVTNPDVVQKIIKEIKF